MGCTNSKLDDLPAVSLCRHRCSHLSQAILHRYAFSDAHSAYLLSLSSVGLSLLRFFDTVPPPPLHTKSRSHSGSHLHFHSDSDDVSSSRSSPLHHHHHHRSGNDSPSIRTYNGIQNNHSSGESRNNYSGGEIGNNGESRNNYSGGENRNYYSSGENRNNYSGGGIENNFSGGEIRTNGENRNNYSSGENRNNYSSGENRNNYSGGGIQNNYSGGEIGNNYFGGETLGLYPGDGFMNMNMNNGVHMNYMKKSVTPSVLYEQRPYSAETVHMNMGEPSSSSSYYYSNEASNFNSYYGGSDDSGYGVGSSLEALATKPPPSPPRGSGWDFLYPFESFESYYPPHTRPSSRDSKEVREEEGIPELEEEHEVVKEVYEEEKKKISKELEDDRNEAKKIGPDSVYDSGPSVVEVESDPVEYEVHVVEKKVAGGGERSGDGGDVAAFKAKTDSDVVREIQAQFERASESGNEVAKILEAGKFPYKKSAAYQVSSKVLQVITPSLPRNSNAELSAIDQYDPSNLDADQDLGMKSSNLSSTLQKLYLWEKKLHEEVKVEEKMRVLHERKCRKLKRLDERGAETHKIDATRALVRSLSTKIRMAIQVVDRISVTINKLRDEELWPQLNEAVQGLTRMWKAMHECHRIQSQAIAQAKRLDAVAIHTHFSDAQLEATMELEHELLSWTLRFSCWVTAQKGFVLSLNNWLMKCLLYVPEETPDGIVPFSPSRLGAPPIFVICNRWAQAMERISEREVVDSMREFASSVLHLWERDKLEMQRRMMANKDTERRVKNFEREDQKIHKEIQALDKRIVLASGTDNDLSVTGNIVYQSETSKNSSLQLSLQHVFEAMERFVSNSVKAYEELSSEAER